MDAFHVDLHWVVFGSLGSSRGLFRTVGHIIASGSDTEIGLWIPQKMTVEEIANIYSGVCLEMERGRNVVGGRRFGFGIRPVGNEPVTLE